MSALKILTITAHYPPAHQGGYEIRCKDIMDGLSQRGHVVRVLTTRLVSAGQITGQAEAYPVVRSLHDRTRAKFFPKEVLYDLLDTKTLEAQLELFKPDVVYLGHTYILSKALLPYLARRGVPLFYDEGGSGLIEAWTEHGRWFRFTGDYRSRFAALNWVKPLAVAAVVALGRGRIRREWAWPERMRVVFNSRLNRGNALARGVPVEEAQVVHSGIDPDLFSFRPRERLAAPLVIFVPGRIERRKGQIDALHLLRTLDEAGIEARLVFAGGRWVDGYADELALEAGRLQLEDRVTIHPMVSQEELVKLYHEADICFFPSRFRTGFSRVPLEATACGCVVISYGNEGSDEVIKDSINGYLFAQEDYGTIQRIISHLISKPAEYQDVMLEARADIDKNFSIKNYVQSMEEFLGITADTQKK